MNLNITYNNGDIGCNNTLSRLINNVWEYAMTELMVTDFPSIKANNNSKAQRSLVHGVGINDADYVVRPWINGKSIICPFYKVWASMIARCYSKKFQRKRPTYIGCTVSPEWRSFISFRSWMIRQDWEGMELDKDILVPGNKIYSPETCVFVTHAINGLIIDQVAKRGKYPKGVTWDKERGKFKAQVSAPGNRRCLGRFDTAQEAYAAARKAKAEYVTDIAQTQPEPIRSALLHHARLFLDVCNEKIKLRT